MVLDGKLSSVWLDTVFEKLKSVANTVKGSLVEIEMYIGKFKLAKKRHHWLIQIIKV